MPRIKNIDELIDRLKEYQISPLIYELGFREIECDFQNLLKVKELIKLRCKQNVNHQRELIEDFVFQRNSLDEVVFNLEYSLDIFHRNIEWMAPATFLFDLYNYRNTIDFINESILLDRDDYNDFCSKVGIELNHNFGGGNFDNTYIDSFMWYKHEKVLINLYTLEKRNEQIQRIKNRICVQNF